MCCSLINTINHRRHVSTLPARPLRSGRPTGPPRRSHWLFDFTPVETSQKGEGRDFDTLPSTYSVTWLLLLPYQAMSREVQVRGTGPVPNRHNYFKITVHRCGTQTHNRQPRRRDRRAVSSPRPRLRRTGHVLASGRPGNTLRTTDPRSTQKYIWVSFVYMCYL